MIRWPYDKVIRGKCFWKSDDLLISLVRKRWCADFFENPMIYWSVWWEGDPLASSRSCPLCSTQSTRASRWNLLIYCDFARTYVITMISPKQYLTPMISPEHLSAFHHPLRRLEHAVFFFIPHPPIFKCIVKLLLKVIGKCCGQQAFINKFWFFHASHENISMCGCTFIYAPMCLATSTHDACSSCESQDVIFLLIQLHNDCTVCARRQVHNFIR